MQNLSLQLLVISVGGIERKYSWPPENKGSHMHGMHEKWLTCALVILSHAQSWDFHMYVPISDDFGVFGKIYMSAPNFHIKS